MEFWVLGGVVLIGLEALIPGFGVFGILGALILAGSLFVALGSDIVAAAIVAVVAIIACAILFYLVARFPDARWSRPFRMTRQNRKEDGYESAIDRSYLLGQKGVAKSVLRPAGTGLFGSELVDIVTEGDFYEAGTPIQVVAVEGHRVVVRQI